MPLFLFKERSLKFIVFYPVNILRKQNLAFCFFKVLGAWESVSHTDNLYGYNQYTFPLNLPTNVVHCRVITVGKIGDVDAYAVCVDSFGLIYSAIIEKTASSVVGKTPVRFGNMKMVESTITTDTNESSGGGRPIGFTVTTDDNIQYLFQAQNSNISFLRRTGNTSTQSWNNWTTLHYVNWTA